MQWPAFYHVLLLCLCCMGACYDWIWLLVQGGLLLGLFQERQHFKYPISSRFIVTGLENVKPDILTIALLGVWSAARGQLKVIAAYDHLRQRMQWKKKVDQNMNSRGKEHFISNQTPYESNLSVSWCEVLKSGSSSLHERISHCWMGTAYLAGLCAGTSQHYIPSTSLSLHVLGPIVREAFGVFIMLCEIKWYS